MKYLFIVIVTLSLSACETEQQTSLLYRAWCKTHVCQNLSQEEWQALRKEHLLPGQPPEDNSASNAAMMGLMAGSVAASTSRR